MGLSGSNRKGSDVVTRQVGKANEQAVGDPQGINATNCVVKPTGGTIGASPQDRE